MRWSIPVLCTLLCGLPSQAQQHLVPEASIYAKNEIFPDLDAAIVEILGDAYSWDARMIALPSFHPEMAVGVQSDAGRYRIHGLRPGIRIWGADKLPKPRRGVYVVKSQQHIEKAVMESAAARSDAVKRFRIARCEADISPDLGARLLHVWERMLRGTRFPDTNRLGPDGVEMHFSMSVKGTDLAGKVWSPGKGTNPGLLVDIGIAMMDYCEMKDGRGLAELERLTKTLSAKLH